MEQPGAKEEYLMIEQLKKDIELKNKHNENLRHSNEVLTKQNALLRRTNEELKAHNNELIRGQSKPKKTEIPEVLISDTDPFAFINKK